MKLRRTGVLVAASMVTAGFVGPLGCSDDSTSVNNGGTAGTDSAGSGGTNAAGTGGSDMGGTGGTSMAGSAGSGMAGSGGAGMGNTGFTEVFAGTVDVANSLYGVSFTDAGLIYVAGERLVDTGADAGAAGDMHTVVARYTATGELDTSFGEGGVALLNVISVADDDAAAETPGDEGTSAVAAMPDGGVVVAVNANDGALGQSVVLVRLDDSGAPVAGFGTDGMATVELSDWSVEDWQTAGQEGAPQDSVYDIDLDTSGTDAKLVLFGAAPAPAATTRTDNDRYVARVSAADGSLDTTFAGDGVFSFDPGENALGDNARRGSVQSDGSIYSFGYTVLGDDRHHIFILGLDADGAPVASFGFQASASCGTDQDGVLCANPNLSGGGYAEAYSGGIQSDGAIVTTGYGRPDAQDLPPDLVSFRFSGTEMDMTYGTAGGLILDSGDEDRGRDMVVLADDRVVHVGKYNAVAGVYLTGPDGALAEGFGNSGILTYTEHDGNLRGVASRGNVVAAVGDGGSGDSAFLVILEIDE